MNFKQAEAAVRSFFHLQWNGETRIAWPDTSFTPPNDTWVRFSMKNNDGFQATIGSPSSNRFRRTGMIYIQIFQKQGKGSTDARDKADIASDIFIQNQLDGFIFKSVNARDVGADNAGWYQWQVAVEFQYDRIT